MYGTNGNNQRETLRRRIMTMLRQGPATAIDISQGLGISEKEVYSHLSHVARTVASGGEKLLIHPAQCLKCGFLFSKRNRFRPPGKCPCCKSTHLRKPAYEIVRV